MLHFSGHTAKPPSPAHVHLGGAQTRTSPTGQERNQLWHSRVQGGKSVSSLFLLPSSTAGSYQGTPKSHSEGDKATEGEEQESLNDCMEQSSPPRPQTG